MKLTKAEFHLFWNLNTGKQQFTMICHQMNFKNYSGLRFPETKVKWFKKKKLVKTVEEKIVKNINLKYMSQIMNKKTIWGKQFAIGVLITFYS